jgi:HNH endonuclease
MIRDSFGEKNSRWNGGVIHSQGRVLIYVPDHPFPNLNGKYVFRYRLKMEEHLGRYLDPKEVIHHVNGKMDDDRLGNLRIMSHSTHKKLHGTPRQTHCKRGHEYTADSVWHYRRRGTVERICKACRKLYIARQFLKRSKFFNLP